MKNNGVVKSSIVKAVLYLLFMILVCCRYEIPGDKYFKDIKKTTPTAVISLSDYNNNDTIYIYQPTQFQFAISATNVNISKVDVLLGSTSISSFTNTSGSFYLSSANWVNGSSSLKIQFTANSGTGSLADHLGAETVTLWRSWVLVVDANPPPAPILTVSNLNGFLKLNWSAFKKHSFVEYVVYQGHNTKSGVPIVIKDPNVTSYVDSSYVGGINTYTVATVAATGQNSSNLTVNYPQSASYVYHASDSTLKLIWRKPHYSSALKSITITENGKLINVLSPSADTTYSFHLTSAAFGSTSTIVLTQNASNPFPGYVPFSFTTLIDNPTNAPHILASNPNFNQPNYFYSQVLKAVVACNQKDGYARVYNSSMKVIDSLPAVGQFSLPYPGQYAYYTNSTWLDNSVIQRDMANGANKTYSAGGAFGNGIITALSSTSNGLVAYVLDDPIHGNFSVNVININNGALIQSSFYWLSDDGRYAINGLMLYSFNGSQFVSSLFEPIIDGKFRPDNNDELISAASPTMIVKAMDGTLLRTITPPDNSFTWKTYDPVTHMLLYTKTGIYKSYLINIDTNEVKTINGTGVAFINGILFDSFGNYRKLM